MQKVARNDPCPCGSQKKYKQCCSAQTPYIPSIDFDIDWLEVRRLEGALCKKVLTFASEKWGPEFIADAKDAFFLDSELEDDSIETRDFFFSWFVFRWIPFNHSEEWEDFGPETTVADFYAREHDSSKDKEFLESISQSPYSFFLVEDIIPSRRMILKDLLLDRTVTIKEQTGAILEAKGKVIFTHLISHNGQDIQIGFGPIVLPLKYSINVLDLKKEILKREKTLTPAVLFKYDNDLRSAYFAWGKSAYQLPEFRNKDGDSIVLCTSEECKIFKHSST
jgi:hypothetical protein